MQIKSLAANPDLLPKIAHFIHSRWNQTVRYNCEDDGTLIGLPFPYTVPCTSNAFQELYYWDTYFTCIGLLHSKQQDLAVANVKNFLFLVNRYGFIPNGNRTYYLNRSQPPYLAPLIRLIEAAGIEDSLRAEFYAGIAREYEFWMTRRNSSMGLARYGNHASRDELLDFYEAIAKRAQLPRGSEEEILIDASHTLSECESGWDFTPRFEHHCEDFCAIDLNANLYLYELLLADLCPPKDRAGWLEKANRRALLVRKYCWNEDEGGFFDYDFRNGRQSPVLSAATFQPLWAGLATPAQAERVVEVALPRLEAAYGIAACEGGSVGRTCQWDHPNGWACVQHIVYRGLARYGYREEALRIASKYLTVVERKFERTGSLWEKYNVEPGLDSNKEEEGWSSPAMMGWTAGVYLDALSVVHPGMEAP